MNLDDDTKIALCKACTLAEVMKDCKVCAFNIGLPHKSEGKPLIQVSSDIKASLIVEA